MLSWPFGAWLGSGTYKTLLGFSFLFSSLGLCKSGTYSGSFNLPRMKFKSESFECFSSFQKCFSISLDFQCQAKSFTFPPNLESFLHFFQDYFSNDKIKMAANIPLHFGYAPG